MTSFKNMKSSKSFWKEVKEVKLGRIKNGVDKELISNERITDGIVRCDPEWKKIKEKLLKEPRKERLK